MLVVLFVQFPDDNLILFHVILLFSYSPTTYLYRHKKNTHSNQENLRKIYKRLESNGFESLVDPTKVCFMCVLKLYCVLFEGVFGLGWVKIHVNTHFLFCGASCLSSRSHPILSALIGMITIILLNDLKILFLTIWFRLFLIFRL